MDRFSVTDPSFTNRIFGGKDCLLLEGKGPFTLFPGAFLSGGLGRLSAQTLELENRKTRSKARAMALVVAALDTLDKGASFVFKNWA
jgi:hypothetical protein